MKKCVCVSCFDHYPTRLKHIILYYKGKDYEVKYLYAGFDHFVKQPSEKQYEDGERIDVPSYNRNLSIRRLFSHYIFAKKTGAYVRKYNPDIVYCMFPPNYLVAVLSKYKRKHRNIRLIYDCYDMWPESFPYSKESRFLSIPFALWKSIRKRNIGEADLFITVSEQGKELLRQEVRGKCIQVIKPLLDVGIIPEYNNEIRDSFSFCYLGLINHITDVDLCVSLLAAFAKHKTTILHIIGDGQNIDELVQRLEAVNVTVFCHGCIFDIDKKNEIFKQCNFGLNIPRGEIDSTMSLKAVEYLRAGLPFLNSAHGDIREIVHKNQVGYNIDRNSIDDFVMMVTGLLPTDLYRLHHNCVETYETLFVNQNLDDILE